jgi:hypothetical protein
MLSSTPAMIIFAVGIWVSFILYGEALQNITRTEFKLGHFHNGEVSLTTERFTKTDVLVVLQSIVNACVAAIALVVVPTSLGGASGARSGRTKRGVCTFLTADVPLSQWLIVAIGYLGASLGAQVSAYMSRCAVCAAAQGGGVCGGRGGRTLCTPSFRLSRRCSAALRVCPVSNPLLLTHSHPRLPLSASSHTAGRYHRLQERINLELALSGTFLSLSKSC